MSWKNIVEVNGITLICLCISLLIILWYFYSSYKVNYWRRRGIEQLPRPDRFFGDFKKAILFQTSPGWHLGELHQQAKPESPFLGFYIFHKPCLLLRDPEIIKQILIRDFENFSDRHFAGNAQQDSIGMKNLFGLKNPAWKYLRSKITPTLTRGKLKQMFPLMEQIGRPMMDFVGRQNPDSNGVRKIDVQELSYMYTTDLIASVALGTKIDSFNSSDPKFSEAVMKLFTGFKRMVALVTVFFIPELVEKIGQPVLYNSGFVKKVFWKAMNLREETGSQRGDFIDSLVRLKNGEQDSVYKFEGDNLLHQSGTFFSGFESSATATAFTLMELAKHPEYQKHAREEILEAIHDHGWCYDAFNDMKYLDQCVAESLRLHPPISTVDRYTRDRYKIPGTDFMIEEGTPIYISLYGIQRDPRFFEDPEVFNPGRFDDKEKISDAYIPFGLGPRMCIGVKIGQLHTKLVIASILKEYEVYQNLDDKTELDPRSTFTAAADGIDLDFRKLLG